MRFTHRSAIAALAALAALALVATASAQTVERRVGDYTLSVRYADEPLLEVQNSLLIEVHHAGTGAPVEGLEDSIEVEGFVTAQTIERRFVIELRESSAEPGLYEAVLIPPALGDYRYHLTGSIDGTPLDETFTSGEGALPQVGVAEDDYTSPGAIIALAVLGLYVLGMLAIGVWQFRERRRRHATGAAGAAN